MTAASIFTSWKRMEFGKMKKQVSRSKSEKGIRKPGNENGEIEKKA